MREKFADHIPDAWLDSSGLRSFGRAYQEPALKHQPRWKHSTTRSALSVLAASGLLACTLAFTEGATASNLFAVPIPCDVSATPPGARPGASLGEINESFGELFDSFRRGVKMINNENTRRLAAKAASRRHEPRDVTEWARKLSSDVADADD